MDKNIKNRILKKGEVLYQEGEILLKEELREPRTYFSILSTVSSGSRKFSEISSKTGLDRNNLVRYLSILEELGLIGREVPVTEEKPHKSKKGIYFLKDNYLNFWFRFVWPNKPYLEMERVEEVWKNDILPHLSAYIAERGERIVWEIIEDESERGRLPFKLRRIGRYWDKNVEIDIVGFDEKSQKFLVGEFKWQSKKLPVSVYADLKKKVDSCEIFKGKEVYYLLISKSGFDPKLKALQSERLILLDLREYGQTQTT